MVNIITPHPATETIKDKNRSAVTINRLTVFRKKERKKVKGIVVFTKVPHNVISFFSKTKAINRYRDPKLSRFAGLASKSARF